MELFLAEKSIGIAVLNEIDGQYAWAVLMRWLLIALLISVVMLLLVAGAMVWHVRRQRRAQPEDSTGAQRNSEEIRKGDS